SVVAYEWAADLARGGNRSGAETPRAAASAPARAQGAGRDAGAMGRQHPCWLEGRGPELCLLAAMDDATGEVLAGAQFMERECAAGYLQLIMAMAAHHGLPWSIYMDHHGSLVRNDDHWSAQELRRGRQDPTQVGRVLEE